MADAAWTFLGVVSGLASISCVSAATRSYAIVNALDGISEIDLLDDETSLSLIQSERPTAISGEVVIYPGHSPLTSLNNEKCSIIEELVLVRTIYPHTTQDIERSRTYKEEKFGLGQEGKTEPFITIDRAAIMNQLAHKFSERFRYTGSIRSVLKPGGALLEDNEKSIFDRVVQLFFGLIEGPILRSQSVLGLSTLLTIVGRLEVLSGGRWMLTAHPTIGELLFFPRRGMQSAVYLYKTSFIWQTFSAIFLAVASVRALGLDSMFIQSLRLQLARFRDSFENVHHRDREIGNNSICVVCLERASATVLVPCGHRALCNECAIRFSKNPCPVCRSVVERCVRVFDV
jgi:hypothetical protein